jgi:hypothetical protein
LQYPIASAVIRIFAAIPQPVVRISLLPGSLAFPLIGPIVWVRIHLLPLPFSFPCSLAVSGSTVLLIFDPRVSRQNPPATGASKSDQFHSHLPGWRNLLAEKKEQYGNEKKKMEEDPLYTPGFKKRAKK